MRTRCLALTPLREADIITFECTDVVRTVGSTHESRRISLKL